MPGTCQLRDVAAPPPVTPSYLQTPPALAPPFLVAPKCLRHRIQAPGWVRKALLLCQPSLAQHIPPSDSDPRRPVGPVRVHLLHAVHTRPQPPQHRPDDRDKPPLSSLVPTKLTPRRLPCHFTSRLGVSETKVPPPSSYCWGHLWAMLLIWWPSLA